ncbi:MAG: GtrA family protein [Clostridia bacterium]|nr:GtrA family protein [Clostridia bacterium]
MNEALRYVFVGVLNTIVGYGMYYIGIRFWGLHFAVASAISQIIGTLHSYIWNRKFTFRSRDSSPWEFVRFVSVYVVQYLVNVSVLAALLALFSITEELAGAIAMCFGVLVSFLGHKFWSFKNRLE